LFLGKSTKTAATRAALFDSIFTKSFVSWGFAPDPTGGAYSAFLDSLVVFRGPTSKERGQDGRERGEEEEGRRGNGKGEEERGRERSGRGGKGRKGSSSFALGRKRKVCACG